MIYFLVCYLLFQFSVGYWASRRIKNETDYLLAGRKIPTWLLSFSLFATWFGAETCIGTSGEVYNLGLSGGRADPFGYSLCLFFLGFLIATKIWNKNYSTLADFFHDRFGLKVEKLASFILIISSLVWGAAQIRAMGQIVSATTQLPVDLTLLISFIVVLSYCLLGGLMGDILTDFIQGLILMLGLGLILFFILKSEGLSILAAQTPERLSLLSPGESLWERMDRWAIPILGSLIAQESISRLLATKSAESAKRSAYNASLIYLIVGSIPVLLGLMGPTLLPGLLDKEQFLVLLGQKYLPPIAYMLLIGALLSAILSSIDSILLAAGGLFSHNLVMPLIKDPSAKKKLLITRVCVTFLGLIIYLITHFSESIYGLVELASSLGSAGLVVITLLGLWTKIGTPLAATVTLLTGLIVLPLAEYGLKVPAPYLFTLLTCLIIYLLISATALKVNNKGLN